MSRRRPTLREHQLADEAQRPIILDDGPLFPAAGDFTLGSLQELKLGVVSMLADGVCPFCKKKLGRGIVVHAKHCRGDDGATLSTKDADRG